MGAVLAQDFDSVEHPVAYASKSLDKHQEHYAPTEGELLAIMWAIRHFRSYLHGHHFILQTDHKALTYLMTSKHLTMKLTRYAMELQEYDFVIRHRPGHKHTDVDALSRLIPDSIVCHEPPVLHQVFTVSRRKAPPSPFATAKSETSEEPIHAEASPWEKRCTDLDMQGHIDMRTATSTEKGLQPRRALSFHPQAGTRFPRIRTKARTSSAASQETLMDLTAGPSVDPRLQLGELEDDGPSIDPDLACTIFDIDEDPYDMLICEQCSLGFHISCLDSPLAHVLPGKWYCKDCDDPDNSLNDGLAPYNVEILEDMAVLQHLQTDGNSTRCTEDISSKEKQRIRRRARN